MAHGNLLYVRGNTGEEIVSSILKQTDLEVYENIYLFDSDGDISQTDFIAIDKNVVYVIEVKSYNKCVIKGSVNSNTWTVCYRSGNITTLNPVKQNNKHIRMLRDITKLEIPCINVVVLPNTASLDFSNKLQKDTEITNMSNLWYVLTENKNRSKSLKKEDVEHLKNVLTRLSRNTYELSMMHKEKYYK